MTNEAGTSDLHADDLLDKEVFDVNGETLGRVTLCREIAGRIISFDVALTRRAQSRHHTSDRIATLMPEDVVATDFAVSLDDDAEHLLTGGLGITPI